MEVRRKLYELIIIFDDYKRNRVVCYQYTLVRKKRSNIYCYHLTYKIYLETYKRLCVRIMIGK